MASGKRRNKRDKYGIYEISNYNKAKKNRKKNKPFTVLGILKLMGIAFAALVFIYFFSYGSKYNFKTKALAVYDDGDYQGAVSLFEEALKPQLPFINKFDNDIRMYLADCYVNLEEYEMAVYEYEKILFWSDEPDDNVKYLENIANGLMLYKWKDYRQALPKLQKAYEDGYRDLVLYVGSCYGQLGDYDNMQIYYNIFLQNNEMNSFMYAQYAALSLDKNDLENALTYIETGKTIEDQSSIKEILFDEIVYYEKIKDYNTAFEKVKQFLDIYPTDQDGKDEYDILYTRQTVLDK
ncbi:MAG: hypothetical protein IJ661_13005 [Lachnospiraceae bacterium]|nr:hypothetical protein [Lachnospiraceae bacterium]